MQRVLREAMDAGAAGFATSFAIRRTAGIDGKPVPSRFADRAEFEALLETMGEVGRGVVSIAPGEQCGPADMFDLQLKVGVPFTWGALLTSPTGYHHRRSRRNGAGWERGAEVWPQVTPRPLTFQFTLDSPYPLAVNEHFAALQNVSIDERAAGLRRPRVARADDERLGSATGSFGLRWDTYTIGAERGAPRARRPQARRRRRRARHRTARLPARPRARGARPRAAGAHGHRQRRRGGRRRAPGRRALHARPLRRRRARGPAVRRAPGHRPARQVGARQGRRADGAGHPQAQRSAGRRLRLRRPRLPAAGACAPTSRSSTRRRWPPVRCGGCATSRPTPSASPPTSRSACSTSW